LACDFFTADLPDGTQTYVLAVIEHATRRIRILCITCIPPGSGPRSGNATSLRTSAGKLTGSRS
jgi:hypothetical protein